jgi:SAM-dependent methyltransferase
MFLLRFYPFPMNNISMTESPDVPWERSQDGRGMPRKYEIPPSPAAVFFNSFLSSQGQKKGSILDVGCGKGRDSVFFAGNGFDVSAVDKSESVVEDLDLYGVQLFCHNAMEYWLFNDSEFDNVMDVLCYAEEKDESRRATYRDELSRVLRPGGHFLISVPAAFGKEKIEKEFSASGFSVVASEESEDMLADGPVKTVNLILKKE